MTALIRGTTTQLQNAVSGGGRSIGDICQTPGAGTPTNTAPVNATPDTTPGSTTPGSSVPVSNSTAAQLLQQAQSQFQAAVASLKSGDLAGYQTHVNQAQILVNEAADKVRGVTSPTTTTVPGP